MDAIIGIVISIVLVGIFGALAKKQAKEGVPGGGAENFPFPFDKDDSWEIEQQTDGRVVAQVADEKVAKRAPRSMVIPESTAPMEVERTERKSQFNLEQAVIYSTILTPKYNDDIL